VILPFLMALFIAILSLPIVFWLKSRGMPNWAAVVIAILVDMAILAGASTLVGRSVNELTDALPQYQQRLVELQDQLPRVPVALRTWLAERGLPTPREYISELLNPQAIADVAQASLRAVAAVLQNTFIVILIAVFILFEAATFPEKLRVAFGRRDATVRFGKMTAEVQRYLVLKTAISAVTGVLIGVWAAILGVDFALFWGLVAFLFNFIPNIGSILAAIPACTLALVQLGLGESLLLAVGYLVVNVVIGNFVEPALMGRQLGLSTLVVVLSLVFWGWVWGPVGMFLSVPLTMIVKIMLEYSEDLRPLALLLGSKADVERARSRRRL
jgi:predicted PurR-regulated permease PerM